MLGGTWPFSREKSRVVTWNSGVGALAPRGGRLSAGAAAGSRFWHPGKKSVFACFLWFCFLPKAKDCSNFDIDTQVFFNLQMLLGVTAVVGHVFPVFANFKGGKGIATILGLAIALNWKIATICILFFVLIVWISRFISVGSMITAIIGAVLSFYFYQNNIYRFDGIKGNANRSLPASLDHTCIGFDPDLDGHPRPRQD
jgi:hypothetical protein